jgi:dienelactone hydrolase
MVCWVKRIDASIAESPLGYADGETALNGFLYLDARAAETAALPGILLIHGGAGLDAHAREQARRYAALGYAVLAADMFGEGVAGDRARIMACITALRDDPGAMARRAAAGSAALADRPEVGEHRAVLGFCFGGLAALTLARSGAQLAAAVSIHGSLTTSRPAEPGAVVARLLVCHGAADPHVPMSEVAAFASEMQNADADWQLIMYGRAVHGFTHRQAAPGAIPGVAYDAEADALSFAAARDFLARAFGREAAGGSPDLRLRAADSAQSAESV